MTETDENLNKNMRKRDKSIKDREKESENEIGREKDGEKGACK